MEKCERSPTEFDRNLKLAAEQYASFISGQTANEALRASLLESAVFTLIKMLETNFEGHQAVLVRALRTQANLIDEAYRLH